MDFHFTVHSVAEQPFEASVPFNGKTVAVQIPGLVVELVSDDGAMTHTLKFIPDDLEAAKAQFEVGAPFTASYARGS